MKRWTAHGVAASNPSRLGISTLLGLVLAARLELPIALKVFTPSGHFRSTRTRATGNAVSGPLEESLFYVRPNAGGTYDSVEFGVFVRDFYSIDVRESTFTVDLVLTARWHDENTKALVRSGLPAVTFTKSNAASLMWLPDVVVTNRHIDGIDIISSQVMVKASGSVIMVERCLALLENTYNVAAFPFDEQTLIVRIASSSLMWDELRLRPIKEEEGVSGVRKDAFEGKEFALVSIEMASVEEASSLLHKSRGELRVRVQRHYKPYLMSILVPEILILGISWAVFWLPLLAPFAMPRVATALISFLSLMTLAQKSNAMLPTRAGLSWIDLFETSCQSLMFFTVVVNTFVLVVYHSFNETEFAIKIDSEMRSIFLFLSLILFGVCFAKTNGTGLEWMVIVTNAFLALVFLVYILGSFLRLHYSSKKGGEESNTSAPRSVR